MKIKLQRIELDQEIKNKLDATIKGKNIEITYYNGYLTKFDKCNVESISPHKIVICNEEKNVNGKIKCRKSVKLNVGFPTFFINGTITIEVIV